jgi:hypothetical protein
VPVPENFNIYARSLIEIRGAIPAHLFKRVTIRSLLYLLRDLIMAAILWRVATYIDPFFHRWDVQVKITDHLAELGRWAAWCI